MSKAGTVAVSLISAIVGAIGSQTLDFAKTRQLKVEERRTANEDKAWAESTDMYRQLYAMRGRLLGSLSRHHFAVIEKEYTIANAAMSRRQAPDVTVLVEREKRVQDAIQQVLTDRAELELLLGWADLIAPEGDTRWGPAITALVELNPWAPTAPPTASLRELDRWRATEANRAQRSRAAELNQKFKCLLTLLKEQRSRIRTSPAVSVRSPI